MWINMLLRTYAWISLISKNGIINNFLKSIGINELDIMYTDTAVLIGLVCNFLPLMVIPIHTSLTKMDKTLIEAAHDLGANEVQTFFHITFKLSMPGVINGVFIVFITAISSFIIPKLLGGGQYMLVGNLIETQFLHVMDWNFGSAISLILIVMIIGINMLIKKINKEG
jgi:spermidine/putrescine transport system permease protein